MRKVYSRLSAEERVRIDELRNREGLGVRQIALRIGRDKSTASRESPGAWRILRCSHGSWTPCARDGRPRRSKAG